MSAAPLHYWAGLPEVAIEHCETSLRLSPRARVGTTQFIVGCAHFVTRRFEEAVAKQLIALQEDPSFPDPYRYLAACYAHTSRLDEAREIINRLRAITPLVRRAPVNCGMPGTARFTYRACAWRPARRHEPDTPAGRRC
jgi:tetratricopeptide (TPR) repeat protein